MAIAVRSSVKLVMASVYCVERRRRSEQQQFARRGRWGRICLQRLLDQRAYLMVLLARDCIYIIYICLARYMLSPVRPSVSQMPSSVHTGSRWRVGQRRRVSCSRHCKAMVRSPRMVRIVRGTKGTKNPRMVRKIHGTKRLWYE